MHLSVFIWDLITCSNVTLLLYSPGRTRVIQSNFSYPPLRKYESYAVHYTEAKKKKSMHVKDARASVSQYPQYVAYPSIPFW